MSISQFVTHTLVCLGLGLMAGAVFGDCMGYERGQETMKMKLSPCDERFAGTIRQLPGESTEHCAFVGLLGYRWVRTVER